MPAKLHNNVITVLLSALNKVAAYAPGITDLSDYEHPSTGLAEGDVADFTLQHHSTTRRPRNPHLDIRLGIPGKTKGLYSFAVPNAEMPEEGKKKLVIQTPTHDHGYAKFTGVLGKGPRQGHVKVVQRGKALINKVTPKTVSFTLQDAQKPTRYTLIQLNTGRKTKDWLLLNSGADATLKAKVVQGVDMDDAIAQASELQERKEMKLASMMVKKVELSFVPLKVVDSEGNVKKKCKAEVADTSPKRSKGLSKRAELPTDHGMLFDKVGGFWMKDCLIPLSIAFMEKSGTIVDIQEMGLSELPDMLKPVYTPRSMSAESALEMPANWFKTHKIAVGDRIIVDN